MTARARPAETDPVAEADLAVEVAAREAADTAEATARANADTTLQTNIDAEATARAAADALKQDAATAATDAELASEASTRGAADTAEASTRASADTTLTAAAAAAQATANAALPKAGGTMTGDIVLAGDPSANLHPATRQYVLAQITALINGAPGTLDTLKEIADQLASDESAVTALTATVGGKLTASSNLADLTNVVTARSSLGLGSSATHTASDFDSSGAAAAAQAASQPLDADLTALAALTTTSYGRSLLELADAAAGRTALGLGTAATKDVAASGDASSSQVVKGNDTRLTDTRTPTDASVTLAKLAAAIKPSGSAAAGDEAVRALGTSASTAAAGNDSRLSDTRTPTDGSVTNAKVAASAAIAGSKLATDVVNDYHAIHQGTALLSGALSAGTYVVSIRTQDVLWSANIRGEGPLFYIDPADYGISGLTVYANLDCALYTNGTAPGTITFTVGLYPITAVAGGSNALTATIGSVTSGSTCAFVNPSNSTRNHVNSGDFAFPAAGHFGFGVVTSANTATNSSTVVSARLRWRIST